MMPKPLLRDCPIYPLAMHVPLTELDIPPHGTGGARKLQAWFRNNLPKEANARRASLILHETELKKHGRHAVRAACSDGLREVLEWLEEVGIHPSIGGGWAVRAAAKGGHLEVLQWLAEHGLEPTMGLRWAARVAAEHGHLETLKWLWGNGLSAQFRAGGGLVRGAAQGGQLEVLQWIKEQNLLVPDGGAWSVRLAAQSGDVRVVQWLFRHGMDMKEHGVSALRGAASGGHLDVLRWVVKQDGAPSLRDHGTSLIWAASEGGHLEVLEWLFTRGVQAWHGGGAAFWAAARGGHLRVLRWLASHGVSPMYGGAATVRAAVKGGYLIVLEWLADNGLNVQTGGDYCGPVTAAERGHLDVLQWLVTQGMDVHKVSLALTIGAARGGQMRILRWLRDEQVAIQQHARSAVLEAAKSGHFDVLKWLAENKINIRDGGWEAVQAAAQCGHLALLQWLAMHGLPMREHGGVAAVGASRGGHVDVLTWLNEEGVELSRHTAELVQEAAAYGHTEVLKWMQERGFDISEGGGNAICRAAEGGHLEALKWLAANGISLNEHWRAAVFAASEAMQPDVHIWLLEAEQSLFARIPHRRSKARHMTPRMVSVPASLANQNLASSHSGMRFTVPTVKESSATGLKWMLQYPVDPDEGVYDYLQRAATDGHMEILHWMSEVVEPRWSVKLAIQGGHLGALQWLVKSGLSLSQVEEEAVRWAAEQGHMDMLKWFAEQGMRVGGAAIEAAASKGKAVLLDLLRNFDVPLQQYPTLAEEMAPFVNTATPTLLANFILVPCAPAETVMESVLRTVTVRDHRGRPISRAWMNSDLHAKAFSSDPEFLELRHTLAPDHNSWCRRLLQRSEDLSVKLSFIQVPGAASPLVLRALAVTPRLQVYHTRTAQAIVLAAWQKIRAIFIVDVVLEMVQLMAVGHLTMNIKPYGDERTEFEKDVNMDEEHTPISFWIIFVIWVKCLLAEVQRARVFVRQGWGQDLLCLNEAWEWVCLLMMGTLLTFLVCGTTIATASPLLSFVGFTRWWKVLYSLRGFDYFGQRILPILGAFREMLPFLVVMAFYGGALMHAFYALSHHTLSEVTISLYRLGVIGEMDMTDSVWGTGESASQEWWRDLQLVWFVAGSFLFTVALMNIFIAIMSSAFDRMEERADADFLRTRSMICLVYVLSYQDIARLCRQRDWTGHDEVIWVCHHDVPYKSVDKARSLRQMVSIVSSMLLSETDRLLTSQEQRLSAGMAEQMRQFAHHSNKGGKDLRADSSTGTFSDILKGA